MPFWQKLIFEFLLGKFKKYIGGKILSASALKEPFFLVLVRSAELFSFLFNEMLFLAD